MRKNGSSKGSLQCFFHLQKIKKQNAYPCKLKKKLKGPLFNFQKCVDQNICDVVEITKNPRNRRFFTIVI